MWFFTYEDDEGKISISLPYFDEKSMKLAQREISHAGLVCKEGFFIPDKYAVKMFCRLLER